MIFEATRQEILGPFPAGYLLYFNNFAVEP